MCSKNNNYRYYLLLILLVFVLVANAQEAHAYINPGSGSDFFQIIYGGLLSVFLFFKSICIKIKNIFIKSKDEDNKYE